MARGWICAAMLRRCSSHFFKTAILLFIVSFLWLQLRIVSLKSDLFIYHRNRFTDQDLAFFANFSAILNSVNCTLPKNLETLYNTVQEINMKQVVYNSEKFGLLHPNDIVIVVQVHNRAQYLYALIESLKQAQFINQTLLVFSHDLYDAQINALVQRIDFAKVIQIFYPNSIQMHPNKFPGHDPYDCPRNMKKEEALKKGCNNARYPDLYGHYREAKFTQTKHHWWWKVNHVMDGLYATEKHIGPVLLLEEDHYVAADFIYVLKMMDNLRAVKCQQCNILCLGSYVKTYNYASFSKQMEIVKWLSSKHNMGMVIHRPLWDQIKKCAKAFCTFDDYNWDWSLQHVSATCMSSPLTAMVAIAPRVFHIGEWFAFIMEELVNRKTSKIEVKFPFPFEPYDVQVAFMDKLYNALADQKIGIFESPTGTGKSLSIICGTLKFVEDFKMQKKEELKIQLEAEVKEDETDWMSNHSKKLQNMQRLREAKEEFEFIEGYEKKIKNLKIQAVSNITIAKGEQFCSRQPSSKKAKIDLPLSDESTYDPDLIIEESYSCKTLESEKDKTKTHILKIFYASRTHSQLTQFINELKRSPFKDSITVTTLASRSSLCINDSVNKLKSLSLINERCTELQKVNQMSMDVNSNKASKSSCCPFYNQDQLKIMQDNLLIMVRDIEDLTDLGKELKACPYYASRYNIPNVELVVLPYNTLLHKSTREACGISLKDNILIIDEAHNLLDAINNMHSAEISGTYLHHAYNQLSQYQQRYCSKFAPKTLFFIKQLLFILDAFMKNLRDSTKSANDSTVHEVKMMSYNEFINVTGVTNINFFELVRFCDNSHISHKLYGFAIKSKLSVHDLSEENQSKVNPVTEKTPTARLIEQIKSPKPESSAPKLIPGQNIFQNEGSVSSFIIFYEFLKTLTLPTDSGRFVYDKQDTLQNSSLKFLHLNPAVQFQDIVSDARSIILAGGTMQPISEFVDQLLIPAGATRDKIVTFSCDHVISPDNLLAITLGEGPTGVDLDFTYTSRYYTEVIQELGNVLRNLCNQVPGGVVCFFPSYDYELNVYMNFQLAGILESLQKYKVLFREPKQASEVEDVLSSYAKCVTTPAEGKTGALLFCIVGGKMSEGINFSNELCRCVVMVGLPYPNKNSPELREKMSYYDQFPSTSSQSLGKLYYKNLCMKAVNQSIGRAIRHKDDYAVIVLLDSRYSRPSIKEALPSWIRGRISPRTTFRHCFSDISTFFAVRKCRFPNST